MSMDVDLSKDKLTREERIYMLTRGRERELREFDAQRTAPDESLATVEITLPEDDEDDAPYTQWKTAELKSEIDGRNADRAPEDQIRPAGTTKVELIAALEQDDMADVPA
jgi:hypothetical protein